MRGRLVPARLSHGCVTCGWKGIAMVTSTCTAPRRRRLCHIWGQTPGTRWLALTMCIGAGMTIACMEGLLHAAPQSPQTVVPPSVYVTHARALSEEALARLADTLDVPAEALRALLTMLEQQQVPASEFDRTLRSSAKRYRELRAMLQILPGDDPAIVPRTREARAALDTGEFARAATMLHEAQAHALQGAQQLQEADTPQRRAAATITAALGTLHAMRLAYAEAATLYRQATDLVPESASDMRASSLEAWGVATLQAGDPLGAVQPLQHALALREHVLGPEHPDLAALLSRLAETFHALGRDARAEPLYQRALRLLETALGPAHPAVAAALNNLAALYNEQRQYAKAAPLHQRVLAIFETTLGPAHPDVAMSLSNLATLYDAQGQPAKAEPLHRRALAIREQTFGPDDPIVATSLSNLAGTYHTLGQYARAEALYQRALTIREHAFGPGHPTVAITLNNLAGLYYSQDQYARAEALYQRALTIREHVLGPMHPSVATSLQNLAAIYHAQGHYAKAAPLYQWALAIREHTVGPEHPSLVTILQNLAALAAAQGQYAEAESLYQRVLTLSEKTLGPGHPQVAVSLRDYAALLRQLKRTAEADTLEARARALSGQRPREPDTVPCTACQP
jgi:tetratricopeptide (TPR) repeat protein